MSSIQSSPPPPRDDPTVVDPLECPPLRWGLIGCGRISHDFTQALKLLPTAKVVACSARSSDSAKKFADKHKIAKHYGSYDELLLDDEVDIVYVGNVHCFRRQIGEKVLKAGKHALLEKPFACSFDDAAYLVSLAKERNLFLMEGMWTRFFPAFELARRLTSSSTNKELDSLPSLGEVVQVHSDFNFNASDSEKYPESFVYNHSLGGGASLLVAPYPIAAATSFFINSPDHIKAAGQMDPSTGVDLQGTMALSFPPTGTKAPALDDSNEAENTPKLPGAGAATLSFGILGESEEETSVLGTKGRLKICAPGHCPTKVILTLKGEGRGQGSSNVYEFPLPDDTQEITEAGGYYYPNSAGLAYEAAAVARCINSGKTEAPQYTLSETLTNMKVIDELRSQLGVSPL